jgi:hypothetical protein
LLERWKADSESGHQLLQALCPSAAQFDAARGQHTGKQWHSSRMPLAQTPAGNENWIAPIVIALSLDRQPVSNPTPGIVDNAKERSTTLRDDAVRPSSVAGGRRDLHRRIEE